MMESITETFIANTMTFHFSKLDKRSKAALRADLGTDCRRLTRVTQALVCSTSARANTLAIIRHDRGKK